MELSLPRKSEGGTGIEGKIRDTRQQLDAGHSGATCCVQLLLENLDRLSRGHEEIAVQALEVAGYAFISNR